MNLCKFWAKVCDIPMIIIIIIICVDFDTHVGIQAEEYTVVLIRPEYVEDLNAPWQAIFAVCRRHPNCINVCNLNTLISPVVHKI